ncbi:MAG: IclR family transcriptional regulator [Clostridia bacterium]|nr:IclR family transcriptional regulator [Clostridia bacterium]
MSKAPAVDYALQIIEFFAENDTDIGIADISNALSINKNAVSRVLEALLEKNWIYMCDAASKKYRLTMKPFSLMSASVTRDEMVRIAKPILSEVHKKLGDSVYLGIKNGKSVLYLLHFDSVKEVRISGRVGGEYPLHCSAPGKVIMSYSDTDEIRDYFSTQLGQKTKNTIVDLDRFMVEADRIKRLGYAVDNEEFADGIICAAAPIFNHEGTLSASIGISCLTFYDSVDTLLNDKLSLLKRAADEISLRLGARVCEGQIQSSTQWKRKE